MTVHEAASLLGIGINQAYAAANRGDIPIIRMGKRFLVLRLPLEKMLGINGAFNAASEAAMVKEPEEVVRHKALDRKPPVRRTQLNVLVESELHVAVTSAAKCRHASVTQFVTDALWDAVRSNSPAMKDALWDRLSEQTKALIVEDLKARA